jgi:hypothetical protein
MWSMMQGISDHLLVKEPPETGNPDAGGAPGLRGTAGGGDQRSEGHGGMATAYTTGVFLPSSSSVVIHDAAHQRPPRWTSATRRKPRRPGGGTPGPISAAGSCAPSSTAESLERLSNGTYVRATISARHNRYEKVQRNGSLKRALQSINVRWSNADATLFFQHPPRQIAPQR